SNISQSLKAWREQFYREHQDKKPSYFDPSKSPSELKTVDHDQYNPDMDVNAYRMHFENGVGTNSEGFWGTFPDQKLSVHALLDEGKNLLRPGDKADDKKAIRYFHLPGNNMTVRPLLECSVGSSANRTTPSGFKCVSTLQIFRLVLLFS